MKTVLILILALSMSPVLASSLIAQAGNPCATWSCTYPAGTEAIDRHPGAGLP